MTDFNAKIVAEFRENAGKVGGHFEGFSLLLMTTTGAKSGKQSISPVMYVADDDRYLVVASNAGADRHPSWYHNLLANPDLTVEVGTETFAAKAEQVEDTERDAIYNRFVEVAPQFAEYQKGTSRRIPVLALHRSA
ncbi:nitroreductase family deazaflavin-dependent oxidoreductase [Nonomuraea longicatena]